MVRLESLTLLFISSPTNSSSIGIDTILTNPAGHHNYCNRHGCHHRPWSEYLRIQYMVRPPPMVFGTALARHAPYAPALAYAFIHCHRLYTNYLYSTSQIPLGSILSHRYSISQGPPFAPALERISTSCTSIPCTALHRYHHAPSLDPRSSTSEGYHGGQPLIVAVV